MYKVTKLATIGGSKKLKSYHFTPLCFTITVFPFFLHLEVFVCFFFFFLARLVNRRRMSELLQINMFVYVYICVCIYTYIYVCMCIYICVCVCIYMITTSANIYMLYVYVYTSRGPKRHGFCP